jgi:ankyrin repeat protein
MAVYYQHQSIVEYLLGRPIHVDAKTTKHSISCITFSHIPAGSTPLLIAAFYGNRAIVQTLLQHGADPRTQDAEGHTALSYAQDFQFAAVERMLRKALAQR